MWKAEVVHDFWFLVFQVMLSLAGNLVAARLMADLSVLERRPVHVVRVCLEGRWCTLCR